MEKNDMLRLGAPILAAGTVFLAGKALRAGYASATGTAPPAAEDLDAPLNRVILFAIATAAVTAVINVSIQRSVARAAQRTAQLQAV